MKNKRAWFMTTIGLLVMIILFVVPLLILLRYSFYEYTPGTFMKPAWILDSYLNFLTHAHYRGVLIDSLWLGVKVIIFCTILGYPVAFLLARENFPFKNLVSAIVIVPLLTSPVVTAFGWIVIISDSGILNEFLVSMGIIKAPIRLMFNETGVIIALVHALLPFMVLSIRATLKGMDRSLEEAAQSLGANPLMTFIKVILPLSLPGIFAGSLLVFINTISAFVTPILLGGGRVQTLASFIYSETTVTLNWPIASAASIILLVLTVVLLWGYSRIMESRLLGGGGR